MEAVPGMSDRLRLFMLPEYRLQNMDPKNEQIEKYSGSKYEPVFTILSKRAAPKDEAGRTELIFGFGCLLTTLVTCFIYGTDVNSLNEGFVAKAMLAARGTPLDGIVSTETLQAGKDVVSRLLPIALGLFGLQITHDIGHYIAAKIHNTKLSLPYYLPSLQIGIFGSITNFLSFPKSRKALFDISISGPALGFLFSLLLTVYGLQLTVSASPEILSTYPAVPTGFFSSSFLLHEIINKYLDISNILPNSITLINPLVAVGVTGLLSNTLNFLPIGKLDGGRVAMAIGGRQCAEQIAFITLIGLSIGIFTDASPIYFFWIVLVVFLQRGSDVPPEDDITPIATDIDDEKKDIKWLGRLVTLAFCITLTGTMVLPVPKSYTTTTTTSTTTIKPKQILAPSPPSLAPSPNLAPAPLSLPSLPGSIDV